MFIELIYDYEQRALETQAALPGTRHKREWRIGSDIARLEQKLSVARGRLQGHIQLAAE
ncbi:MAG: hypothetical protein AB7T37_13185 [Dehalococcoidia bacterium]